MKSGLKNALVVGISMIVGAECIRRIMSGRMQKYKEYSQKHLSLYLMMNQWVKVKQENKSVAQYLEKKGYKQIAIYGMNYAGEALLKELEDSSIEVAYGIDRNASTIYADVEIYTPDDNLRAVDAIVVTAITFFDEIEDMLSGKVKCPIISLEDILYEV